VVGDILQPTHLLFVLVVALLVLGPKRLPEVAKTLGNGLRDFRSALSGDSKDDDEDRPRSILPAEESPGPAATSEPAPAVYSREPASVVPEPEPEPEPEPASVVHEPEPASVVHEPEPASVVHEPEPASVMHEPKPAVAPGAEPKVAEPAPAERDPVPHDAASHVAEPEPKASPTQATEPELPQPSPASDRLG
jgi:sec-independent protein translocase protein TatA